MDVRVVALAALAAASSALAQTPDTARKPQTLGTVSVTAERPTIAEFEERRLAGFGHFITRAELEKQENRRTGDILARMPGTWMVRGSGGHAWIANSRGRQTIVRMPQPADDDLRRGAQRVACYASVYLDGSVVYTSGRGPLFDVNQISPNQIEAIEYYSSASQIPPRFNRTDSACGVLVIWTRR